MAINAQGASSMVTLTVDVLGTTKGAPSVDLEGRPRATPPAIGAYEK